jgi:putative DNA primase/helicase
MVSSEEASVDITTFLTSGIGPLGEQFHPKPGDVNATLQMLMRHPPAIIPPTVPLPGWLPEATAAERDHDPLDLISCKNGLVNLRTDERMSHTPHLLTTSTTSYDHRPQAKRKRFEKFLDEIFPGSAAARPEDFDTWDPEQQEPQLQRELLQEVFGYLISRDTRQQKIFLFIGRPRSGKGTLARILRRLLGEQNVIGFSLDALDNDFGAEDLIDKQVAIVGDARLDGSSGKEVAQLLTWSEDEPVTNKPGEEMAGDAGRPISHPDEPDAALQRPERHNSHAVRASAFQGVLRGSGGRNSYREAVGRAARHSELGD